MRVTFDENKLARVVSFLQGEQDVSDVKPEEIFEAAGQGLIKWEDIVAACGKGAIPLSFVVENPQLFPSEVYDQAISGAYFA